MRVPVPVPCHIRANDQAEIDISVVGFSEYETGQETIYGHVLTPCCITAFMCPNAKTDTPPSAWTPVQTSDDGRGQKGFREFYDSIEYEINDPEASISEYEETVIAYFTKTVTIEKTATYSAI